MISSFVARESIKIGTNSLVSMVKTLNDLEAQRKKLNRIEKVKKLTNIKLKN
jgi:hypothetical protein